MIKMSWKPAFATMAISVQTYCCHPLYAASTINDVDNRIAIKLVELDKLCMEMIKANTISTIKKRRRQYLYALLNSGSTEAGLITATALFSDHTDHVNVLKLKKENDKYKLEIKGEPNTLSGGANAGQLYPQIIGQEINGLGNAVELGENAIKRFKAKSATLDPRSSLLRAKILLGEIDQLLQQSGERSAFLQKARNLLCKEFATSYVNARSEFTQQNLAEAIDFLRNAVGATGNQLSVSAGYTKNNHLNGAGNILSLIAAGGITGRLWFADGSAKITAALARGQARQSQGQSGGGNRGGGR